MSFNKGKHADVSKDRKAFYFPSRSNSLPGLLDPEVEGTRSLKPGEMFAKTQSSA